jgi:hypothetical protein
MHLFNIICLANEYKASLMFLKYQTALNSSLLEQLARFIACKLVVEEAIKLVSLANRGDIITYKLAANVFTYVI